MVDEKNRSKRRISINDAGIERRRAAIQAIVDQPVRAEQVAAPPRLFGPDPQPPLPVPRPAPPPLHLPERNGPVRPADRTP
ncbi:hypothetical protein [Nonomuraea jiangxiensis]|uniref:hypothetical protein n=1 Tax=Nonomuraea jiangxiensis TaxID=633440 RepID=UPI0015A18DEF|nr:hypothetical protein [Nonomuraea jiangxiensis]